MDRTDNFYDEYRDRHLIKRANRAEIIDDDNDLNLREELLLLRDKISTSEDPEQDLDDFAAKGGNREAARQLLIGSFDNSFSAFVRARCVVSPQYVVTVDELVDAWAAWSRLPADRRQVMAVMRHDMPEIKYVRNTTADTHKYKGITLKIYAENPSYWKTRWITNGTDDSRVAVNKPIPAGWRLGRKSFRSEATPVRGSGTPQDFFNESIRAASPQYGFSHNQNNSSRHNQPPTLTKLIEDATTARNEFAAALDLLKQKAQVEVDPETFEITIKSMKL